MILCCAHVWRTWSISICESWTQFQAVVVKDILQTAVVVATAQYDALGRPSVFDQSSTTKASPKVSLSSLTWLTIALISNCRLEGEEAAAQISDILKSLQNIKDVDVNQFEEHGLLFMMLDDFIAISLHFTIKLLPTCYEERKTLL